MTLPLQLPGDFVIMLGLNILTAVLAWLGRQGTRAVAASILLGLAVPPLAAYVKPHLGETVFVLLLFSYLRTDPAAFRRYLRAPGLALVAAAWVMVALPLMFGTVYAISGLRETWPALYTIMVLHIATAPITSSAAFAALMGLDVALSLLALILCNILSPITSVAFSYLFLGTALFSPIELGAKLFFFFAASGAVAFVIRRLAGQDRLDRHKEVIDGLNVIAVFAFAVAAMDRVPEYVMADPLVALGLLAMIATVTALLAGVSMLVFMRRGIGPGLVIGLLGAFRNLGVVMAAIGATLPEIAWFYFALAQFPIYIMPALLKHLVKRLPHDGRGLQHGH